MVSNAKNSLIKYVFCLTRYLIKILFTKKKPALRFWGITIFTNLFLILFVQLTIAPVRSQIINLPEAVQQTPSLDIIQIGNLDIGKVRLDGKLLFRVATPTTDTKGNSQSASPIERRVKTIEFHLRDVVKRGFDPNSLKVKFSLTKDQEHAVIFASDKSWGSRQILAVTPYDVELDEPGSIKNIAERWSKIIKKALLEAREKRQFEYQKQQIPLVLGMIALMIAGSLGIKQLQKLRESRRQRLEKIQKELEEKELNLSKPNSFSNSANKISLPLFPKNPRHNLKSYLPKLSIAQQIGLNLIIRRVLFAIKIIIWFSGTAIIFQRFPQTYAFGAWLIRVPLAYIGIPLGVQVLKLTVDAIIESNIKRIVDRIIEGGNGNVRLRARAQTILNVLKELTRYLSVLLSLIVFFYVVKALHIILIFLAAIAFLSQNVLQDFLQTYFILVEDQYALGDWVQIGDVNGQVEQISLRASQIRSRCGDLVTISHGSFTEVTNFSHCYSGIDMFIDVAYDTDLDQAIALIEQVAQQMQQDALWKQYITAVRMKGVEAFGDNSITIRLILNTKAAQQWDVGFEYRRRLKPAFDQAGIDIPFPQRSIWFKNTLISPNTIEN